MLFFLLVVIKLGTESKSAVKFINVPHRLSRFFFLSSLYPGVLCVSKEPQGPSFTTHPIALGNTCA